MKNLLSITLLAVGLCLPGYSQTTNSNPILEGPAGTVWNFLASGSNWIVAPYGIYDTGTKEPGVGIAALIKVNNFVLTGLRLDYLKATDELWMPSIQSQLQVPINAGKVKLIPMLTAGLATPISGRGEDNEQAIGIFGLGFAVQATKNIGLFGHIEKWTDFDGNQFRFGAYWKF